jgi:hypothetical protein
VTIPVQQPTYLLVYMPYIGLDSFVRVGKIRLVRAEDFIPQIADVNLRKRVRDILNMHRVGGRIAGKSTPIEGIGILHVGQPDFREFNAAEQQFIRDFRSLLFLSCLAQNNRMAGPNAGHFLYTSENFDIVEQKFDLVRDYIAETSGRIVRVTNLGYKIGVTQFLRPTHVLHPSRFRTDAVLLQQLDWLRQRQVAFYNRVLRATAVFLESYYNAENVDIRARILLQVSAFEILFDLPDKQQRKIFKDHIERLTKVEGEKRFTYSYEVFGKRQKETRTVKAMWADRFYTLRNHIIHGNKLNASEYNFRGQQHHLLIAPLFFVHSIKQLIDELRVAKGREQVFTDRLHWTVIHKADEYEPELIGFSVDTDFYKHFEQHEARKARRQARKRSTAVSKSEPFADSL